MRWSRFGCILGFLGSAACSSKYASSKCEYFYTSESRTEDDAGAWNTSKGKFPSCDHVVMVKDRFNPKCTVSPVCLTAAGALVTIHICTEDVYAC